MSTAGSANVKLLFSALLAGGVVASWPSLIFRVDSESTVVKALQWSGKALMAPGIIVGFLAAGGNGHIMNFWVMTVANGVFYSAVSYWLLMRRDRRKLRHFGER